MAATNNRTVADVRRDIASEREQLAVSVENLRTGLGAATDIGAKLRGRLPAVAAGAFGAAFVAAGGIGAAARLAFRRGREGREKARFGPFAFIDRR
jgi:uncharacterized membrane protein